MASDSVENDKGSVEMQEMAHDAVENDEGSGEIQIVMTGSRNLSSNRGEDVIDGGPLFPDQMDNANIGSQSNEMSLRKNYAYGLLDVALLMANVSQLKAVLDMGESYRYYQMVTGFISSSLVAQILLSIILLVICTYERNIEKAKKFHPSSSTRSCDACCDYPKHVYFLDYLSVILVFAVIVINAFISAFVFDLGNKVTKEDHFNNITTLSP